MPLRVLVVEDSSDDAVLILRYLALYFGDDIVSRQVSSEKEMNLALAESEGWDCVICDYNLPGFEWPRALNMVRRWRKGVLFIVVSGVISDDKGKLAIQEGADDYLEKHRLDEIGPLTARWLRTKSAYEKYRVAVENLLEKIENL